LQVMQIPLDLGMVPSEEGGQRARKNAGTQKGSGGADVVFHHVLARQGGSKQLGKPFFPAGL